MTTALPTRPGISWDDLKPFTSDNNKYTSRPWFHDGYAWATDGRILVRAAINTPGDLVMRDSDEIKFQRNAAKLLTDETDVVSDWTKANFPPGGIPKLPYRFHGCSECGRPWERPRRPPFPEPVAVDGGRIFFDAHYLRLLDAFPLELDFFVREPRRAAFFTDGYAKFVGILMPLQPSADQALDAIRKQWGKGHE